MIATSVIVTVCVVSWNLARGLCSARKRRPERSSGAWPGTAAVAGYDIRREGGNLLRRPDVAVVVTVY
ncbi:MAG TPA: hypothetical protein VJX66_12120 [Amycolatopsis sp.]|nr:hypothetical protein [Amycolatopsis sp.]